MSYLKIGLLVYYFEFERVLYGLVDFRLIACSVEIINSLLKFVRFAYDTNVKGITR